MNQETRLLDFAARQQRRPLARGRRGGIDPSVMLPTLARLLAIDAAEEQAVGATDRPVGERGQGDGTGERPTTPPGRRRGDR